ncbi:unnamed protein product [Paramecium octaurelia]|uniref:Vesicle transport v-SNARE N-terminal domain-containing protein n=1 Tax=Paramecium octaurelia TaxID=43137 RepID=A0A8S1WXJ3_PAROT|nr:unnamed protein product [Paramecium octaurelia]
MSQTLFLKYENDFQKLLGEFNTNLQQYPYTQSKNETLQTLKSTLQKAEKQFQCMQIELKASSTLEAELKPKLKQHGQNLQTAKDNLTSIEKSKSFEQSQPNVNFDNKRRLENNTNKIESQTNQLENCHKELFHTVDLQQTIMTDLDTQKKQLLETIDNTNDIRKIVQQTGRDVRVMQNRELFSKALKLGLIGVLTLGNIMLIYYKI